MAEVNFNYNGTNTLIQCTTNDKLKYICSKYCIKLQIDINKLIFIYGGEVLNIELEFNRVANQVDKQNSKMKVLVYNKISTIIDKRERIIKSKDIICPKCGEICLINFNKYKIELNNCKNKHENIITINDFDNTQNINESKIICDICKNNNKGKTFNNIFYICGICNINICPLCKDKHNKEHILIDYDNKNYLCYKHDEQFVSYCEKCKENLCMQCDMEHDKNHKIILYRDIKPDINEIKNKMKEFKDIINKFNNNIDEMISLINNIKMNIKKYYILSENILNSYNMKNRNYQIFYNINNMNNNIILNDLKGIIEENDISNKFNKIFNLNNKIKNNEMNKIVEEFKYKNEINLIYKTENKGKQNLFGKNFVKNNKNNIELIINGIKSPLIEEYDLEEGINNIKLIIKNDLINLEGMFKECSTLYNIDELKYLNTSNCINFSRMFMKCSLLSDIKALEKWDVSKGTDFSFMFSISNISDLKPLENWDVSNAKNFDHMLSNCCLLTDITPLKNWNVSNVINFNSMFYDCSSLSDIKPLENWNISKGIDFIEMFDDCSGFLDKNSLGKWKLLNKNFK